ncbi:MULTISPECIES: DoxX family protein [unclassified Streptomyces]|uniref:DoxX family protein n=1 Tax=unclassified Streptomyces TaxID=2593676 RepID=UPI00332B525D
MSRSERSSLLLAGLLATAGVAHFASPKQFDATIPRSLPGSPRTWTYASGVVELALAAGIAVPRTRRTAALAAAGFFVGVFPANVQMALDWRDRPTPQKAAAYGRLPLQIPLVVWARSVAKNGEGRS